MKPMALTETTFIHRGRRDGYQIKSDAADRAVISDQIFDKPQCLRASTKKFMTIYHSCIHIRTPDKCISDHQWHNPQNSKKRIGGTRPASYQRGHHTKEEKHWAWAVGPNLCKTFIFLRNAHCIYVLCVTCMDIRLFAQSENVHSVIAIAWWFEFPWSSQQSC